MNISNKFEMNINNADKNIGVGGKFRRFGTAATYIQSLAEKK